MCGEPAMGVVAAATGTVRPPSDTCEADSSWGRRGVECGGVVRWCLCGGPQAAAGVETGESGVQRLGWRWISGVRGLGFEERFNNTYNKRV